MNFRSYLARLEDTLYSRKQVRVENERTVVVGSDATFVASVRFYDNSLLVINEAIEIYGKHDMKRANYVFHYQHADGVLIFRYDNSPHYPHLATFPAHKHLPDQVIAAEAPDLADVLREIDALLYPRTDTV